jgi:methionyl-tRNA formyltransferase
MSTEIANPPLRIVTFNVLPIAYSLISRWAAQAGHQIVLVVTTPGPSTRRTPSYRSIVTSAPPEVDILVTTRLRTRALPLIQALKPDLLVSFSFPYRIPPEICAVPRYGAVNLHPAALPAYRGPNVMRVIYEQYPLLGATLHWIAEDFDTGNILAQQTAPLPENVTSESVIASWGPLMAGALAEGVTRAVAGDPGQPQAHSQASYAAAFSEAEHWLDPQDTKRGMQCKTTALNMMGSPAAKIRLGEQAYLVATADPLPDVTTNAPGTVSQQTPDGFTLAVADGMVRIQATSLAQ